MRMNLKSVVLALATVGVTCTLLGGIIIAGATQSGPGGTGSRTINSVKTAPAAAVEAIDVRTVSSDVTWHETSEGEVKAHLTGYSTAQYPPELVVNNVGGTLTIEVRHRPQVGIVLGSSHASLEIYVPKKSLRRIGVHSTSGDIRLAGIEAGEVKLNTVSGEIVVDGLSASEARVSSTSGDLELSGFEGSLDAHTVSGDLDVQFRRLSGGIQADSTSGNVKLDLPDNASFTLDAGSVSGHITCDFPITVSGARGDRRLSGTVATGETSIRAKTTSGDIRVF